jgi:hypothetical protein
MKRLLILLAIVCVALSGCGGGGGGGPTGSGGNGAVVGRVLNVVTGGPLSPAATVQVGNNTSSTSPADGSFTVTAKNGSTTLLVDTHNATFGVWSFTIPAVSGTVDAGDVWVGPEKVTVTGRVIASTDLQPIAGAKVSFAGRTATTDSTGIFSLTNVAYSSATQTAFWGIAGSAVATGFFNTQFSTSPAVANSGVVTVSDVVLTPLSDTDPPPLPSNIIGRVLPLSEASGTIVTLKDGTGNAVRIFNVGSNGAYGFWIAPGSYTVTYQNGSKTATSQSVTLGAPDQVIRVPDAVLHG